jgi:prephenate dehydratase
MSRMIARVAFQGEPGAFSEEAARELLGAGVTTLPQATFAAAFRAVTGGAADAAVLPIENTLAGSVLRVYDLLLESDLSIRAESVLLIEHCLIGCPGATIERIRTVESHPMALAQCERLLEAHPHWKRVPAEDTAGSVRDIVASSDRSRAAIAGRAAALRHGGVILSGAVQDDASNFTRFLLVAPDGHTPPGADKMTLAIRLAHLPGALVHALEPFSRRELNLLKIESRPIHGCPWEYQFFLDIEADSAGQLGEALAELRRTVQEVRILGFYPGAHAMARNALASLGRKS